MKKLFGIAGVVLFLGTSVSVNAQTSGVNSSETPAQPETNTAATTVSVKSSRAERDFTRNYKNASSVEWYDTYKGGTVVYFTEGNIKMKSAYDKRGTWLYTLRFFNENEISADAKSMVKESFSNYSIIRATEVERFDKKVLLVYIQDDRNLKTVRIMDEEMDIVEEYRKPK